MKIVLINKLYSGGGAAIACRRLFEALKLNRVDAKLLIQEKKAEGFGTYSTTKTMLKKGLNFYRFIYEKIIFLFYEKSKNIRFLYSLGNTGEDISKSNIILEADIIHLHWVNQGFLSLKGLKKVIALGKPVIWTLHDMWPFTGGCHYSNGCGNYKRACGDCPFLRHPGKFDLSNRILEKKKQVFANANLSIVPCSEWLSDLARQSVLFKNFRVASIPNPIDTDVFKPLDKGGARKRLKLPEQKKLVLFGSANIFDERKGFSYLLDALSILNTNCPDLKNQLELLIFGKSDKKIKGMIPFNTHFLSFIHSEEEMVHLYNAADLFVIPSLEDNLPNTIMESMSCGTPVLGFDTGGIPEMIKHKENGYIAKYRSSEDLADGIYWIIFESDEEMLRSSARNQVIKNYSPPMIAEKYRSLYIEALQKT